MVLRSRAHGLLSSGLALLSYRGRRSGAAYSIPVLYAEAGPTIVALAAHPEKKLWWRTFRSGAPAVLRIGGRDLSVHGRLVDGDEARDALRVYLGRFPRAARTLGAAAGDPDLRLAEAACRVALVTFTTGPEKG